MPRSRPKRIAFLLIEGYALMSAAAAVEPLRAANLLAGRALYELVFLSTGATQARASVGCAFDTVPLSEAGTDFDMVFVVAGGDPLAFCDVGVRGFLHRLAARGVPLGGISGGAAILQEAGVLENRRFTVHWQHFDALQARAPEAMMERRLFVIDRDRFTCAGGSAPLDMMHALIAAEQGAALAREISDWFIHTGLRPAEDPQRLDATARYDVHHPALVAMIGLMEAHIADPMTLAQLARLSGIGARQLERLCRGHLGQSAMQFYRHLRLAKAADLLRQTALPIIEVGLATGFPNNAYFSRAFRQAYGISPSDARRKEASATPGSI
ncbi:GlxA family transcriptional regulator [Antarcticimicrobium sediminis]|uniref:GlxA family transcriptional regulator n=1 Tax=Antarcticimicrobium sediminis TaxID=2546227 RepID=A0A4R5ELG8_9RHOB|nr:GlxA family transcriptional regulator [Antarcticimicrobium sediminis]TDE35404.1 GlxA family transcriptional regulator [Antarcticimicrobium sediminis]